MYALMDPHWGEPKVVISTIRDTEDAAWDAALTCKEAAFYSGASEYPIPRGTRGSRERLEKQGYKVMPVSVETLEERTAATREAAASVYDLIATLIEAGTPNDGLKTIIKQNADELRALAAEKEQAS